MFVVQPVVYPGGSFVREGEERSCFTRTVIILGVLKWMKFVSESVLKECSKCDKNTIGICCAGVMEGEMLLAEYR